jgi:hypothetical protein
MASSKKPHLKIIRTAAAILLFAFAAFVFGGCSSTATKNTSKSTTNNTQGKPATANLSAQGLKVLAGDVPGSDITDLARVKGSIRQSDTIVVGANGKQSGTLIYQTSDTVADVVDYYTTQAEREDWTLVLTIDTKDGKILQMTKGSRKISVNIARREGIDFTDITITYREF